MVTGCEYSKGDWGECDASTGQKERTDTLISAPTNTDTCNPTRVVRRACRRNQGRKYILSFTIFCYSKNNHMKTL